MGCGGLTALVQSMAVSQLCDSALHRESKLLAAAVRKVGVEIRNHSSSPQLGGFATQRGVSPCVTLYSQTVLSCRQDKGTLVRQTGNPRRTPKALFTIWHMRNVIAAHLARREWQLAALVCEDVPQYGAAGLAHPSTVHLELG